MIASVRDKHAFSALKSRSLSPACSKAFRPRSSSRAMPGSSSAPSPFLNLHAVEILRDGAVDDSASDGLSVRVPSAKATISFQPSGRGIDTTVEGVSRFL